MSRLRAASAALGGAVDEFVAAHAEERGGHAPFLWATRTGADAIIRLHPSWIPKIQELMGLPEHTVYSLDLDTENS